MKKSVKIVLIVIVVIALAAAYFYSASRPLEVDAQRIERSSIVSDFKEDAKVISSDKYSVSPPYDAKLVSVVKSGDNVTSGQLLAVMDDSALRAQKKEIEANIRALGGQRQMQNTQVYAAEVEGLQAEIRLAESNVQSAQTEYERINALYLAGAVPLVDVEAAQKALENAQAAVEIKRNALELIYQRSGPKSGVNTYYTAQADALRAQLERINSNISKTSIYSPSSGIVTAVYADKGAFVSSASPLLDIQTTDALAVSSMMLVQDAAALRVGQNAVVVQKIRNEEKNHPAMITDIGDYAVSTQSPLGLEEQRVEVKLNFSTADQLFIGYDVDVIIETLRKDDVIVLPKTTVFEIDRENYVWKIENDVLIRQPVQIGQQTDFDYEIVSGLEEGDYIIMDPNNSDLEEGKKVSYDKEDSEESEL